MRDAMRSRAAWIVSMLSIYSGTISFCLLSLCLLCLFVAKTVFKHLSEVDHEAVFDDAERCLVARQFFDGSNRFAFAGNDEIEVAEIRIDVQGKAVRRDPTRDVDPNCRHFAASCVHAGETFDTKSFNTKVGERANQHF